MSHNTARRRRSTVTHARARERRDGTVVYTVDRCLTHGLEAFVLDRSATRDTERASYAAAVGCFRVMGRQTSEARPDHGRIVPLGDAFTDAREAGEEARRRIDRAVDALASARLRSYTTPFPPLLILDKEHLP